MSDGIIGSVGVSVVPDANDFWRRFQAQTSGQAREAGVRAGRELQRGLNSTNPTVRVGADTTRARAQIAALNKETDRSGGLFEKLIKTAITLSPAIVPIAAAAGAAAAEFGALGAAGALALKGLRDDYKGLGSDTNAVVGLVGQLKGSLNELSQTAAHGALPGLALAQEKLRAQLPAVNGLIREQSSLLGSTLAHLAGGLAGGLGTFAPVLNEVSGSVERIAAHFEAWATGPGGAHFAQVLSSDYARVAPIIDDVAHSVAHLIEAGHASGLGILSELQLLAGVVDAFPTPVLEGIIAAFVSARTISAVSGVFETFAASIQKAYARMTASSTASAATVTAASAEAASAAAAEAATIATSQAEAAAAYAAAQLEIAQATLGTEGQLTGLAAASVEASATQAAAAQAAAEAAVASAAEMAAAAETAAAASTAAAETSAVSWSAVLGPIGIVVGAVALLGLSFANQSNETDNATQSVQDYTAALVQSSGALSSNVRQRVASNQTLLGDMNEFSKAGIRYSQVIDDVTRSSNVNVLDIAYKAYKQGKLSQGQIDDLITDVVKQRRAFDGAVVDAGAVTDALGGLSAAQSRQIALLHTNAAAYRDAKKAAQDSTTQAQKQTLQWQLENDAGQLLAQTLDKLAGKSLSFAQAENQFQSQLVTLAQTLQQGGSALTGLSSDAIQNRSNLLQLVQSAEQTAEAFGNMKGSSLAGRKELIKLRQQIIDNAVAHGENRKQVERYIDSVLKIPTKAGTEITLNDAKARAQARALRDYINGLHASVKVATLTGTKMSDPRLAASGGYISGPGSGTSDSIPARLSNGEFVVNARQTSKHRSLLESVNSASAGFAGGGLVGNPGDVVTVSQSDTKHPPRQKKGPGPTYTVAGQKYSSFQAAENAASRLFKAEVQLGVKIDDKDLTSFRAALKGTVSQAQSAFATLYADAKKLGISDALAKTLRVENAKLDSAVDDRNKAVEKLKTVNDEFKQVHDSVLQAGQGSFDLTSAGTGFDGQQPVTLDNIEAQQTQAANLVKAWAAGLKKLAGVFGKTATGKAMLQQLAEGGPGDYPEVKALLSGSPKDLAGLVSTQAQINSTSSGLGTFVGTELYGSQIKHLKAEIKIDEATVEHLADKIGKQVTHAVDDLADRPVKIYINGREIATAAAAGTKINARRT